jgi:hypothetical protein
MTRPRPGSFGELIDRPFMQVGLSGRCSDQALTAQAQRLELVNLRVFFLKKN